MSTVLSTILILLLVGFAVLFVQRWIEDGLLAAKGWAVGLFATILATIADWWEAIQGVFQ